MFSECHRIFSRFTLIFVVKASDAFSRKTTQTTTIGLVQKCTNLRIKNAPTYASMMHLSTNTVIGARIDIHAS